MTAPVEMTARDLVLAALRRARRTHGDGFVSDLLRLWLPIDRSLTVWWAGENAEMRVWELYVSPEDARVVLDALPGVASVKTDATQRGQTVLRLRVPKEA